MEPSSVSGPAESGRPRPRSSRRPISQARGPLAHQICEGLTEALIYAMVLFSPWAFGTTDPWAIRVMNFGGGVLGALLLAKWIVRWHTGFRPSRWSDPPETKGESAPPVTEPATRWLTRLLAALTVAILGFCGISAWNARVGIENSEAQSMVTFLEGISWLPRSYDQQATWFAFWTYLPLALAFWATHDWLLGKTAVERRRELGGEDENLPPGTRLDRLPARLERLLWVLALNGGLLATEAILQRLSGTNKLLWLVRPLINQTASSQFGPYAYRSNAAQYFNLVWPLSFGLWWVLRSQARGFAARAKRAGTGAHAILLPFTILMAACPVISTSRGGALVSVGLIFMSAGALMMGARGGSRRLLPATLLTLAVALCLAGYLGWPQIKTRFEKERVNLSGREVIYKNMRHVISDFPWFGTGPGAFVSVYGPYREGRYDVWDAYGHNDWLQTRMEWGAIGMALIVAALGMVPLKIAMARRTSVPWLLTTFCWLALGGCLVHAIYDFPLQIHSILFLFLLEAAILFAHGARLLHPGK
ncbi:MAG TPA: O-antigen ligase family protein [Verrucomicrobiae bacterium]|nr:O-antigen ligase family protein [Verrucomicrobiae bacterium]